MLKRASALVVAGLLAGAMAGCADDRPADYGRNRPPIDEINPDDRGLQSKDVLAASSLVDDLLALPQLNRSPDQWTVVFAGVENNTNNPRYNLDVFLDRLRSLVSEYSEGRIAVIENRARLRDLQAQELEQPIGAVEPGPAGIQPEYALYAKVNEMMNRETSYYQVQYNLTNLRTREQVWSRTYDVRVRR